MIPRVTLTALAVLCAGLLFSGGATASYDPVASGSTRLAIDKGFARLLAANGVELAITDGDRRGRSYSLPVSGGIVDPAIEKAEIETEAVLVFQRGRHRLPLRKIVVRTKREPLIAKVGGSQLKVAAAGGLDFQRTGFGARVTARPLRLTAKFATRLGKKLRLHGVFEGGQVLGSLSARAEPLTLAVLPSGRVTFAPDPAFLAKLDGLFVSVNPIAPAERTPGPLFTVPFIPAGTIAPSGTAGVVRTGGGLEFLQLGAGQVFWHELWLDLAGRQALGEVDLEPTPTYPGKLGQLAIATLADAAVSPDPRGRTVALSGAGLALTATAAGHFNQAFAGGKDAFHAGEPIGSLSFVAKTQ